MKVTENFPRKLFHREEGIGRPVVLLHSSASSGGQWNGLVEHLKQSHRVIIPDLPGYGRTEALGADASGTLDDEADAVHALIKSLGEPVDLIGHSFGGAVAMKVALRWPEQVKSLTIIEPVLFHLLRQGGSGDDTLLWQVKLLSSRIVSSIVDRDPARGMQHFVEFWNGAGAWRRMKPELRDCLTQRVGQVQKNFAAVSGENWPLEACREVSCPVLAIMGGRSVAATRRITELLVEHLPNAKLNSIEGAGHMAPVTHGQEVSRLIEAHLADRDRSVTDLPAGLVPAA